MDLVSLVQRFAAFFGFERPFSLKDTLLTLMSMSRIMALYNR